jgi:polyphosphate kinase 2 (PPK2 family)
VEALFGFARKGSLRYLTERIMKSSVTRVHPEYIMNENLPGIETVDDVTPQFWENRMQQINNFEKHITQNGTIILKFFCI